MTGAAAMIPLTPAAGARLDEYLHQVRAAVARVPEVSPAEIEADIREHIEAEFHGTARPVTLTELEAVLVRLGPPAQWVPSAPGQAPAAVLAGRVRALREAGRGVVRGAAGVLWRGPEDWRLPYLTFGVFALGVVAFPLFPLCLVVSYLLGRAALAVAAEKGVTLGARRWLVYPPLVLVALPLLLGLVLGPVVAIPLTAEELKEVERFRTLVVVRPDGSLAFTQPVSDYEAYRAGARRENGKWVMAGGLWEFYDTLGRVVDAMPGSRPVRTGLVVAFATVGAFAAWWAVLGAVGWAAPGLPRAVFVPLLGGFEARHGRRLFTAAAVGLVLWGGAAYRLATAAEPGAPPQAREAPQRPGAPFIVGVGKDGTVLKVNENGDMVPVRPVAPPSGTSK